MFLSNNLTHLTFGNEFDQQVDHLPNTLTCLTFGKYYNQSVMFLPNTITKISFFSHNKIRNNIQCNTQCLNIRFVNVEYDEVIDNIPSSLKEIIISDKKYAHYIKKIPFGCKVFDNFNEEIILTH
jgi:hypothetical protein